jgi:V8-like Glu-specific endopeptidase
MRPMPHSTPLVFVLAMSACVLDPSILDPNDERLELEEPGVDRAPIFSGSPTSDYEGTAALTRGSGQIACSGTLIRPRIVLTAAHCIDIKAQTPAGGFGIFFGTDPSGVNGGVAASTLTKFLHPLWDPDSTSNQRYNNDIALLVLDKVPTGIEPVPLYPGPLTSNSVGDPVTMVGFGVANDNDQFGIKRMAHTTIAWVGNKQVAFVGPEGTCSGDSGGPTYIAENGTLYVMSVHSTVSGCGNASFDVRVDAHLDSFLLPKIEEIEAILATEPEPEPEPTVEPEPEAGDDDADDDDEEEETPGGCSAAALTNADGALLSALMLALLVRRKARRRVAGC